jgi:hypothetical protein
MSDPNVSPWAIDFAAFERAIAPYVIPGGTWSDPNGEGPLLPLNGGFLWKPSGAASGISHHVKDAPIYGGVGNGENIEWTQIGVEPVEYWQISGDLSAMYGKPDSNQHVDIRYTRDGEWLVPETDPNFWEWSSSSALPAILVIAALVVGAPYVYELVAGLGVESAGAALVADGAVTADAITLALDTGAVTSFEAASVFELTLTSNEALLLAQLEAGESAAMQAAMAAKSAAVAETLASAGLSASIIDTASKLASTTIANGGNVVKTVASYIGSVTGDVTGSKLIGQLAATVAATGLTGVQQPRTVSVTPALNPAIVTRDLTGAQPAAQNDVISYALLGAMALAFLA